jgi:hypothetical protein
MQTAPFERPISSPFGDSVALTRDFEDASISTLRQKLVELQAHDTHYLD